MQANEKVNKICIKLLNGDFQLFHNISVYFSDTENH